MKKLTILFVTLFTTLISFSQSKLPKQRLEVTIDGKTYSTNENDTLIVDNKPIIIKIAKTQIFKTDKISFEYQNHFSIEKEIELGLKSYVLDGDDLVISNFDFTTEIGTDDLANEMIKEFGKKNCKLTSTSINLNSNNYKGHKLTVTILNSKLTIEIYEVSNKDNQTQMLLIQDSKEDDGSDSAEYTKAIELLNKTLTVK